MSNLTATILFLTSLGLFFGYINPAYRGSTGSAELRKRSVTELREERARYREALEKTREIETARTGLLTKYNGITAEDREKLLKLLPDHVDSVRLIIDINNIAAQYSLTLRNIALSDLAGGEKPSGVVGPKESLYATVGLSFALRGSYENFRSFVRDSERSLRLMDISALSFAVKEAEEGRGGTPRAAEAGYDYAVTVSTYRLR